MISARDIIHRRTTVTIAPVRTDPCAIVPLARTVSFLSSRSLFCQKIVGSNKISIAEKKVTRSQRTLEKRPKCRPRHPINLIHLNSFLSFIFISFPCWPMWSKFRFRYLGNRTCQTGGQYGLNLDSDFSAAVEILFFSLFFWVLHYSREDSKGPLGRDLDFHKNISALDSLRNVLDDESESLDRLAAESK